MNTIIKSLLIGTIAAVGFAAAATADTNSLPTEKARVSYAIGQSLGHNFKQQDLDLDVDVMARAIKDVLTGSPEVFSQEQAREVMMNFQKDHAARQQAKAAELGAKNKVEGAAFLAANKSKPGVKTTMVNLREGGTAELQYSVITEGTGPKPIASDKVTVHYRGTLLDGKEFDSSYKRGQPVQFPVGGVIQGWTAALQMMNVGSKWTLFIPAELAYGEQGRPGIPPNSVLIFEVELLATEAPAATGMSAPAQPITSDIVKVQGTNVEVIKAADVEKMKKSGK